MHNRRRLSMWAIIFAAATLIASSCGDDTIDDTATTSSSTSSSTSAPATSTTETPPVAAVMKDVGVYFVAEVGQPARGGVVEALAGPIRSIEVNEDATADQLAEETLAVLLSGPSELEAEIGFSSAVPAATLLHGVEIEGGIATVDLSAEFEAAAGAFSDVLRVSQIVFTLTSLDEVDAVRFRVDGELRSTIGSHGVGLDADAGTTRDDLPEARPPILIEAPAAGTVLSDSLMVSGESNTFEGTIRWALTDPDGEILEESFTTATAGNGTWGTFEFTVSVPAVDRGGLGALILWEDSPEDGRQVNLVEVPLEFPTPS